MSERRSKQPTLVRSPKVPTSSCVGVATGTNLSGALCTGSGSSEASRVLCRVGGRARMRAPASAGVRAHGWREGGQPLPPVPGESRVQACWMGVETIPQLAPGGRGRGQGEGGQVATGRAGVVIVTGSWRPTKTQKTLEGWKMGVIQIKFFKAVSVFFLIIKVTHAAIRIFYENLLMCY